MPSNIHSLIARSALGLALAGCPSADDSGGTNAASGSSSGGTADTNPTTSMTDASATMTTDASATMTTSDSATMTTTADTTDPTDPTDPTTTTDPTDPTDATTTTSDPDTGTGTGAETGPGGVCDADPQGDPCNECVKASCCAELETCDADPDCACVLDCLAELTDPGFAEAMGCATDCGADFLAVALPLQAIDGCRMQMCGNECA